MKSIYIEGEIEVTNFSAFKEYQMKKVNANYIWIIFIKYVFYRRNWGK